MAVPLLSLQDINLTFGGTPLLHEVTLHVAQGDRICLVGRNGSGKSTLLKVAAGLIEADSGKRVVRSGTTIRYLPQEPDLSAFPTTLAYVEAGLAPGDDPHRALYLLQQLSLSGEEDPRHLSGGEQRRAALARTLAPEPDVLLLDEPTNHLDLPAIEWLEAELAAYRGALVIISHDRRFLTTLSRATLWLDRSRTRRLDQGFAAFEQWRDQLLEQEERDQHKLDRKIAMELDWLRYGVTARRKRNQGRLRALAQLRQTRREQRRGQTMIKGQPAAADASGKLIVEAIGIGKSFSADTPVIDGVTLRILRGDRIGFVGANGAGKTTLINLLTGALAPDHGTVRLGVGLEMATLDQSRAALDPSMTLADTLTGGRGDTVMVGGTPKHVVSYMKDFLFSPEQARTPVGVLSGGERARLLLAKAFASPSNLLVLDEPTNDLDLETLDLLQEMICDYAGTVLLVSHDRDFLDRTVSALVAAEGNGKWLEYAGGYTDMLAQRNANSKAVKERHADKTTRRTAAKQLDVSSGKSVTSSGAKRKLTFTEQHELDALPGKIDKLQQRVSALQTTLGSDELFATDPDRFARCAEELSDTQKALLVAEERWLELEEVREGQA